MLPDTFLQVFFCKTSLQFFVLQNILEFFISIFFFVFSSPHTPGLVGTVAAFSRFTDTILIRLPCRALACSVSCFA